MHQYAIVPHIDAWAKNLYVTIIFLFPVPSIISSVITHLIIIIKAYSFQCYYLLGVTILGFENCSIST